MSKKTDSVQAAPIVLIDGDKGGVGKSVVAGAFVDWLHARRQPVALVDGDARNPDVGRLFEDVLPVGQTNLRHHDGWMDMTDFIFAQSPDRTVVVSMPAGIGGELKLEANTFSEMARQLKRPITLIWVINRSPDSVNLLNNALEAVGAALAHKYVFKNLFFAPSDKFRRWNQSQTRKHFEETSGAVVDFPELHERALDKLMSDPMPYSAAVVPVEEFHTSPHGLTASELIELTAWLREVDVAMRPVAERLGIAPAK